MREAAMADSFHPLVKTGDDVTVVIFKVPLMESASIFIKVKTSLATKATGKTFMLGSSQFKHRFKQAEQGLPTEGLIKGSYRFVVPQGDDPGVYIEKANLCIAQHVEHLVTKFETMLEIMTHTLRVAAENLDDLPVNTLENIE
jgi:hypothetical protein